MLIKGTKENQIFFFGRGGRGEKTALQIGNNDIGTYKIL
jgi:hypothetical protein